MFVADIPPIITTKILSECVWSSQHRSEVSVYDFNVKLSIDVQLSIKKKEKSHNAISRLSDVCELNVIFPSMEIK
ncbi:CLUMA_CG016896, isoform A [Clunio marinus]|uniref:CLUMA_CG016896, isoform A n=1 Tax=Clunio marinus TaxID=568069 RepID=A0A1J1IS51_9DIPT|nr:CLUMA_CG016896, isoform A [Clunio marinus]